MSRAISVARVMPPRCTACQTFIFILMRDSASYVAALADLDIAIPAQNKMFWINTILKPFMKALKVDARHTASVTPGKLDMFCGMRVCAPALSQDSWILVALMGGFPVTCER